VARWGTTLLFYLGFQLLLPVVPLYAAALGAREAQVGLIMGIFALSAMVLRPVAGDLADRIGRRPLVLLGTAIFLIAPVGYALVGGIPALLVVRLFHGTGMGFGPTAATVVATDLTPAARRGAAMGLFGLASAVALAVGPFAGGELVRRVGFVPTFLAATGIEVLALGLAWTLPETRPAAAREGGVTALPATPALPGRSRASGGAGSARRRSTRPRSCCRSTSPTAGSPRSCRSSRSAAGSGTPVSSTPCTRS
jgi:MFS family permease